MTDSNLIPPSRSSIRNMTERLLLGEMSREELEHFEVILLNDPAARLVCIEHINLHAQLSHLGGAVEFLQEELFSDRSQQRGISTRSWVVMTVLTCCLMLACAIYFGMNRFQAVPQQTIGHLRLDYATGATAGEGNSVQQPIRSGETLTLPFGMSIFQLSSGVGITLHGPAKIQFESSSCVKVESGTLVANVPPKAVGFRVQTPHVEIIDLGTAFRVTVGSLSEVKVFQGEVSVKRRSDANSPALSVLVKTGETMRFSGAGQAEAIAGNIEEGSVSDGLQRLYGIQKLEGDIELLGTPPASVEIGKLVNESKILLFQEKSFVELSHPLQVVPPEPKTYQTPGEFTPLELPAGTRCSSLLVHCDYRSRQEPMTATIRFDRPILGLIFASDGLHASDPIFARPETKYPPLNNTLKNQRSRGCIVPNENNLENLDQVRIHDDGLGLTLTLNSPGDNIDQMRILLPW